MIRRRMIASLVVASSFFAAAHVSADPRTPEVILAEYEGVKMPEFDATKREDAAYRETFMKQRQEALNKRNELALELFKAKPDHPRVVDLMKVRWQGMVFTAAADLLKEVEPIAAGEGPLAVDAAYFRAAATVNQSRRSYASSKDVVDAFIAKAPKDERAIQLLSDLAEGPETKPEQAVELYRRILKDYSQARGAKYVAGKIRQAEGLGKPFELAFQCATTGESVDMAKLKGKVVVVDFWATWCGPCIAEMPKMKELYATYKPQGVEFIGVSLDQPEDKGGLTKLKDYCKNNNISWPQYYMGKGWESEFSASWGINAIPAIFIVDAEGNLHSTKARGKLETLIPELIAKRDKK